MPDDLVDLGGGVKMIGPNALTTDPQQSLGNTLSLINLQQQIANAPLEKRKLEADTKLRENEVLNINIRNLRERADLLKAIGDEERAMSNHVMTGLKQATEIFLVAPEMGLEMYRRIDPSIDAEIGDDGTATIDMPSLKTEVVDGVERQVPSRTKRRIVFDPNKLSLDKRLAIEKEYNNDFQSNQDVKDFGQVSQSYKNLQSVSDQATGQGDWIMIREYANIANPGSNIRPGDSEALERVGGLPAGISSLVDRALTTNAPIFGKDKDSIERKNFKAAAKALYDNRRATVLNFGRHIVDFGREQGLNPKAMISPVGDISAKQFLTTDQQLLDEANKLLGE